MAESSPHQASVTSKPRLKRALFPKPTWAQQDDSSSATDFFRRSDQSYRQIAAEAERKRQRKLARKRREQTHEDKDTEPARNRRRESSESDSAVDSEDSRGSGDLKSSRKRKYDLQIKPVTHAAKTKSPSTSPKPKSSPMSLSNRYESATTAKRDTTNHKPLQSNVIDLGDGEEDEDDRPDVHPEDIIEVTATKRSEPIQDEDDFPPSDDEYAELARKAREKARRKRLEAEVPRPNPQNSRPTQSGSIHELTPLAPAPVPDPVVSILISSAISNTNPLIINQRISQRLKGVRLTWCQRQDFTPDFTERVFLTLRGKRLFDVTTCKSLGIGVDAEGNIVTKGRKDILGDEERQVHMEATTDEMLVERERAKRQEAQKQDEGETEARGHQPRVEEKEAQVRIILKAKGFEDFRLMVKPTTRISRIVNAFKSDKKIDDSREVFLSFDGDRLTPETQVADTELNDMDYIDVYVK
ncbi:MAG: hypothetical protein Q9182_000682 [Xanthomendoza sp. 2 TL-2023]